MQTEAVFEEKLQQMERGKALFQELTDVNALEEGRDAFVLVLTDTPDCVKLGTTYLPAYIDAYHYRPHIYSSQRQYDEAFEHAGGMVHACDSMEDVHAIARYIMMFGQFDNIAPELVFLTDKNDYGSRVEGLLERGTTTLDDYVKYCVFSLKNKDLA